MNDEAALIRAISSAPLDEAPRLVYADWLEERGDPKFEVIRVQCEMNRWPPYHNEYFRLRQRRNELWANTDSEWLRSLHYVPTHRPLFSKLPESRLHRWRLVDEFLDLWGPRDPSIAGFDASSVAAAEADLGVRLPAALREWYELIARRGDAWTSQDRLFQPSLLRIENDTLIIRCENQSCEKWGIRTADFGLPDPPAHEVIAGRVSSPSTTAFAIQSLLYDTKFSGGQFVELFGQVTPEALGTLSKAPLTLCDVPNTFWVATPIRFLEGIDLLVEVSSENWVWLTARNEGALSQLSPKLLEWLERTDVPR